MALLALIPPPNCRPPHSPDPTTIVWIEDSMGPQVSLRDCIPLVRSPFTCYPHQGAQEIISELNTQRSAVTKLMLNHNPLGDDGVSQLFNYLRSTLGSKHRIALSEISLNCTNLGCKGLQAIADYIRGNDVLKIVWLASVRARCLFFFAMLLTLTISE